MSVFLLLNGNNPVGDVIVYLVLGAAKESGDGSSIVELITVSRLGYDYVIALERCGRMEAIFN